MRAAIPSLLFAVGLVVVAAAMAACGPTALLRTLPSDPDWQGGCGLGVGRDLILRGSAADPRLTWATDPEGRNRSEILWPVGHRARFTPFLEILDARGTVVGRDGDKIIGSCSLDLVEGEVLLVEGPEIRGPDWQSDR